MGCGASKECPALPSPALPAPPAIVTPQSDDVHDDELASPAQPAVSFEPPKLNEVVNTVLK